VVNAGEVAVGLDVNSREHPTWFSELFADRSVIEAAVGSTLEWDEKPGNKFSTLRLRRSIDARDAATWPEAHGWTLDRLLALRDAFRPRVAVLT
jgi:hypothetical protein